MEEENVKAVANVVMGADTKPNDDAACVQSSNMPTGETQHHRSNYVNGVVQLYAPDRTESKGENNKARIPAPKWLDYSHCPPNRLPGCD